MASFSSKKASVLLLMVGSLLLAGCTAGSSCEAMMMHWAEDGFSARFLAEPPPGAIIGPAFLTAKGLDPTLILSTVKREHAEIGVVIQITPYISTESPTLRVHAPGSVPLDEVKALVRDFAEEAHVTEPDQFVAPLTAYAQPDGNWTTSARFPPDHDFGEVLAIGVPDGAPEEGWSFWTAPRYVGIVIQDANAAGNALGKVMLSAEGRQLRVSAESERTRDNQTELRTLVVSTFESFGWPTVGAQGAKIDPFGGGWCAKAYHDT